MHTIALYSISAEESKFPRGSCYEYDSNAICLCEKFSIHHIQHENDIHLKAHEPAVSEHLYRQASDHQAVLECESAVIWSMCRVLPFDFGIRSSCYLSLFTCVSPSVPTPVYSFQMPGKRCIFLLQQTRRYTRSYYIMWLRISSAHTKIFKQFAFHSYVKFCTDSSAEIDYSTYQGRSDTCNMT